MAAEKEPQATSSGAGLENTISNMGKYAWIFALIGVLIDLIVAAVFTNVYNVNYQGANQYHYDQYLYNYYSSKATSALTIAVLNYIFLGVCVFIFVIYVFKPFSTSCASRNWEALITDKIGGKFSKMWLMALLLAGTSWVVGGIGLLLPVLWLTFSGPGKGRVFK
nr:hypothetical protein [Candidatus Sigynarchaeum springense]